MGGGGGGGGKITNVCKVINSNKFHEGKLHDIILCHSPYNSSHMPIYGIHTAHIRFPQCVCTYLMGILLPI